MAQKSILIVEDESDLRDILRAHFEDSGYTVFEAENSVEALRVVGGGEIDVVVSDIRMPGGDGLDFLAGMRLLPGRKPPVVLASGYCDVPREKALELGAVDIITKPFRIKDLLSLIEKQLS